MDLMIVVALVCVLLLLLGVRELTRDGHRLLMAWVIGLELFLLGVVATFALLPPGLGRPLMLLAPVAASLYVLGRIGRLVPDHVRAVRLAPGEFKDSASFRLSVVDRIDEVEQRPRGLSLSILSCLLVAVLVFTGLSVSNALLLLLGALAAFFPLSRLARHELEEAELRNPRLSLASQKSPPSTLPAPKRAGAAI